MSKFAVRGHPLHPMFVSVPIGLFVAAFVFDFVYIFSGENQTWYDAATFAGGFGAASALVAALPGLGDYFTLHMGAKSRLVATLHLVTNVALIAVFTIAFLLMLDNGATDGVAFASVVALHAAGMALLGVSGWLGGELIYVHGVLAADTRRDAPESEDRRSEEPVAAQRR